MTNNPLGRLSLAGFALPAIPLSSLLWLYIFYVPPLYASEFGLGMGTVGTILLLTKLFDTITDVIFGAYVDKTNTRWGKRRPWLIVGTPLMALALYFLYANPLGTAGSAWYLAGWLFFYYFGWTMLTIGHTSWALDLSSDYDGRSRITGVLQVMSALGIVLVAVIPMVLEQLGDPSIADRTSAIATFLVFFLPLTVIVCLLSASEVEAPPPPRVDLRDSLRILKTNKPLLRVVLANFLMLISYALVGSGFAFFVSDVLLLGEHIGTISLFLILGGLASVPIWVRLCEKISKHVTFQITAVYGILSPLLLLVLPAGNILLAIIVWFLIGVTNSAVEFIPRTLMADVCDHDNVQFGSSRMGMYYAILQVCTKLGSTFAVSMGLWILAWIGYVPGTENTPDAIDGVRYVMVFGPVFGFLSVYLLMRNYPLDKDRQVAIREIIDARDSGDLPRARKLALSLGYKPEDVTGLGFEQAGQPGS